MKLFRKRKSKFLWYDFAVRGVRFRGSTKETNQTRAEGIAALKFSAVVKEGDPLKGRPPTLREYSKTFLGWVDSGRLEDDSRRYYRNGWRLLEKLKIAGMRMDKISKRHIEKLRFPGSPSNGNNALRTLRRMFSMAVEDKLITKAPEFKLFKEHGRSLRLNDAAERVLVPVAEQPLKDIIVVMRDTGSKTRSAASFNRSERPCSLKSLNSGALVINLSSTAMLNIRRRVLKALLPFDGDPGNLSFSICLLEILSMRMPAIFSFSIRRHPLR